MAIFIPAISKEQFKQSSEQLVYEYLSKLNDKYFVLYSLPWVNLNYKRSWSKKIEGQADFVILHPERGLLVIEVKGGSPELKDGTWSYINIQNGNKEPFQSPFDQARESRLTLLEKIEFRTKDMVNRRQFIHGDMVIFPECSYRGQLPPPDSDPVIFVDSSKLAKLDEEVEKAFVAWNIYKKQPKLSAEQMNEIIRTLRPDLKPSTVLGLVAVHSNLVSDQSTRKQTHILKGLGENNKLFVKGTAGSGKSFLALDFAISLANEGKKVLFLYTTKALGQWLWKNACIDPRSEHLSGDIEFIHFQRWAVDFVETVKVFANNILDQDSLKTEIEEVSKNAFPSGWNSPSRKNSELPQYLTNAISFAQKHISILTNFDAIIVDEAQDIPLNWWKAFDTLASGQIETKYYIFADPQQNIHGSSKLPSFKEFAHISLNINQRNAKPIAQSAFKLLKLIPEHHNIPQIEFLQDISPNTQPYYRIVKSSDRMDVSTLEELRNYLKHFSPKDIALIGPTNKEYSPLNHITYVHDESDTCPILLTDDPAVWLHQNDDKNNNISGNPERFVLVTTPGKFKGLEAQVVIIYNLHEFDRIFSASDLYVAWTRARNHLVLICKEGSVLNMIKEAGVGLQPSQ